MTGSGSSARGRPFALQADQRELCAGPVCVAAVCGGQFGFEIEKELMYVCPDCKTPLSQFYCKSCAHQYDCRDGIPTLLSREDQFKSAGEIARAYDAIYTEDPNIWEKVGRTSGFLEYFCSLLAKYDLTRYLEIGSGEGFLLQRVPSPQKYATDLSFKAIKSARERVDADFSIAIAERLPFPSSAFNMVVTVGVMEHFLDSKEALREIRRVLKSGGYYVNLIHVDLTFWDRVTAKFHRYFYPRPRPIRFARWLARRASLAIGPTQTDKVARQPIQNRYTTGQIASLLTGSGFDVVDVITAARNPAIPLKGDYVVIFVCQNQEGE